MASVLADVKYYRLDVTDFPIYVTASNFEMIVESTYQFFVVHSTPKKLNFSVSHAVFSGAGSVVSADHCQGGTQKQISIVYPVDSGSVRTNSVRIHMREQKETRGDVDTCEKVTNFGLNCLNAKTAVITQDGECGHFCHSHFKENLRRLFYLFTSDCVGTRNGRQYKMLFKSMSIENAAYKNLSLNLKSDSPRLYSYWKRMEPIPDRDIVDYIITQPWIDREDKFRCLRSRERLSWSKI
jgi:hypothetical protein